MGRSKELWMTEVENIFQSYVDKKIEYSEALKRLKEKGYSTEDATDELDGCTE